ncbi:hypothetical protein VTN77DRAFT_2214 [Rasamsonia byssochlamydoides]|uniref:uncharacterized protein n=1 Tax=Rasamsonia byssochlamydoides TaxID=89139 RepID=UPI0037443F07
MRVLAALLGLLSTSATALSIHLPSGQVPLEADSFDFKDVCPLAPKVSPPADGLHPSSKFVEDDAIKLKQAERLSKAVQIPSTSTEAVTDPYDDYFAPFLDLHRVLGELFPLTHAYARVEKVNRLGLIFTLNGTNDAVKPLLLTAHQDVVPIDDASDWTYPPFSGHFDGQWLWGRGASDCKNVLIGLLSAVEDLLQQGWEPTRTVVLAFGFDEESHGWGGAGEIAKVLEKRYGRDSFELVLDEGGMGLRTLGDVVYALPGVGEKGSIDLHLALSIDGGHSSVPPPHTGIGIIAEIIYHLERDDLFVPRLDEKHPSRKTLECQARHSPEHVEPWLASALESDDYVGLAEAVAASRGDVIRFTYQTSQAVDLIKGGVKINALPEKVNATVNYRVALHESPDFVKARAVKIIKPIVEKYNLSFSAFGSGDDSSSNHLSLTTPGIPLVPAPISPTDVRKDAVWARFSGVARSVFESVPSLAGKKVVVSGDVMTGNTDTRFYWNLTRNIYRWSPTRAGGSANIHTVDERLDIAVHLEGLALYYDLIRSFDKWES